MTGPVPPVHPDDNMPEGWEDAARAGWAENPVARAAGLVPQPPVVKATFGRAAYDAYLRYSDGKSLVTGETLPTWDDQKPDRQAAWDAAADEVVRQYEHFRALILGEP